MMEPDDFKGYEPPRRNGAFIAILTILLLTVGGILWGLAVALDVTPS